MKDIDDLLREADALNKELDDIGDEIERSMDKTMELDKFTNITRASNGWLVFEVLAGDDVLSSGWYWTVPECAPHGPFDTETEAVEAMEAERERFAEADRRIAENDRKREERRQQKREHDRLILWMLAFVFAVGFSLGINW